MAEQPARQRTGRGQTTGEGSAASAPAPVVYTLTLRNREQAIDVLAEFPAAGAACLDLHMAVWSPGFYRLEDYAARVSDLHALDDDGAALEVQQVAPNRWRVVTGGAQMVHAHYRLTCRDQSVTTNWLDEQVAVINGPASFIVCAGAAQHPHEVHLVLPDGWQAETALPAADQRPCRYRAANFDVLADSPILAGILITRSFTVAGSVHVLAVGGQRYALDVDRAVHDLEQVVRAHRALWGSFPYARYCFLVICREGGGGLEHADSTLITAAPTRVAVADGYRAWIGLASHEYFHAVNVKRLRPVELGPFDYLQPPQTAGLWFAEGITSYYGDLLLCRAGFVSPAQALAVLSTQIGKLQAMPGRRLQTLEQSSIAVWSNSFSGLNTDERSVSYYHKGHVVAFLLDARIRQATQGAASLDDLMRLANARFSGERGFTPAQMRAAVAELAGDDVAAWLDSAVASTGELDYAPALAWFGLRFVEPDGAEPVNDWQLEFDEVSDEAVLRQRQAWLAGCE